MYFNCRNFHKNHFNLPNEFLFAPRTLQRAVDTKSKLFDILKVENALEEMKLK